MSKIISVFSDRAGADFLINKLLEKGYPIASISVVLKEDVAYSVKGKKGGLSTSLPLNEKGGYLQGIGEILYEFGSYLVPGIGSLIIAGKISKNMGVVGTSVITVSGATTGVLAGGLSAGLEKLGLSTDDAKLFEMVVKNNGVLLLLSDENTDDFKKIIHESNAKYIRKVNLN